MENNNIEEIVINEDGEYEYDKYGKRVWNVPMNTEYIDDKKMDYKTLGIITYFSNWKGEEVCDMLGIDISELEYHRYLYEKGNNSVWSNKEEIEKISKNKLRTIKRNIDKLVKCGNNVVSACKDKNGRIYYKINTYAKNGDGMGKFVTIDSRVLRFMCNVYNSNTIKAYCVLKILLYDSKKSKIKNEECYKERRLTIDFITKWIGLSTNSKNNLQVVSDIMKSLNDSRLIKRRKETIIENDKIKTVYYYSMPTLEYFLNNES